jgi:flagellar motor switch protein FliN
MQRANAQDSLDRMQQVMDVPLTLRAELDQKLMTFGELLDLDIGSIIRLSRPTGENIDIYTGDVLIGWGEILLVDGNMAVRIADLRDASLPDALEARIARTA